MISESKLDAIPAKVIYTDENPFEIFYVELKFRKKKWLLNCS